MQMGIVCCDHALACTATWMANGMLGRPVFHEGRAPRKDFANSIGDRWPKALCGRSLLYSIRHASPVRQLLL